ncbi:MAG: tRNA (adenosine(37)-N6)-threonylcarbamoyltransferase complex ATPase subunit type 1 TsaE [Candidatus Moraniibacteriota bacterium]|nr:MAG: tRNA (adenosine(37)-N6)-threonylcarbamoyltransferase complex ATPase subunit type 1 TsaE [Candidatus Moranbacteria bacterium]
MKLYRTNSVEETKDLAQTFSRTLSGQTLLCLEGGLGSGKTTFTQGILSFFNADPPYTSPTFSLIKEYPLSKKKNGISFLYHIDAYRIQSSDILNLGWEEIIQKPETLILLEWPENISSVLNKKALFLSFVWESDSTRSITLPNMPPKDIESTTNVVL